MIKTKCNVNSSSFALQSSLFEAFKIIYESSFQSVEIEKWFGTKKNICYRKPEKESDSKKCELSQHLFSKPLVK